MIIPFTTTSDIEVIPEPLEPEKKPKGKRSKGFAILQYSDLENLARVTRSPIVLAISEIHRLWFISQDKTKPFSVGNAAFSRLGFDHHSKDKALRHLESAGIIKVERRKGKTPLVSWVHLPNY
jgi:hypothetical protein